MKAKRPEKGIKNSTTTFVTQTAAAEATGVSPTRKAPVKRRIVTNDPVQASLTSLNDPVKFDSEQSIMQDSNWAETYQDDDYNIYFDKRELLDHLAALEDANLFTIHLVDEEEVKQGNEVADMQAQIAQERRAIEEVESSIAQLQRSRDQMTDKLKYLSGYLGPEYIQRNQNKFKLQQAV